MVGMSHNRLTSNFLICKMGVIEELYRVLGRIKLSSACKVLAVVHGTQYVVVFIIVCKICDVCESEIQENAASSCLCANYKPSAEK